MVEAKETIIVPVTSPNKAPAASVKIVAPGRESAVAKT